MVFCFCVILGYLDARVPGNALACDSLFVSLSMWLQEGNLELGGGL